jgi:hypothetical protein
MNSYWYRYPLTNNRKKSVSAVRQIRSLCFHTEATSTVLTLWRIDLITCFCERKTKNALTSIWLMHIEHIPLFIPKQIFRRFNWYTWLVNRCLQLPLVIWTSIYSPSIIIVYKSVKIPLQQMLEKWEFIGVHPQTIYIQLNAINESLYTHENVIILRFVCNPFVEEESLQIYIQ